MAEAIIIPEGYFTAVINMVSPNEYIVKDIKGNIVCRYLYFRQRIHYCQYDMLSILLKDFVKMIDKLNYIHR